MEVIEPLEFKPKQVVHRRNAPLRHVYFPMGGLISVLMPSNGKSVEVAMIGNEGFFGLPVLFRTDSCPMTALAQMAAPGVRLRADAFQEIVRTDDAFAIALGRYAQAYTVMVAQGAVCNSAHRLEQRCAKWLLMAHDRLGIDQFPLTQLFLAQMLGVRRATVSEVAEKMQEEGLISYRQGKMTILDRRTLEEVSCVCYGVIRREFDRMAKPNRLQ
jgi:CRP-like cAMP-binding protein